MGPKISMFWMTYLLNGPIGSAFCVSFKPRNNSHLVHNFCFGTFNTPNEVLLPIFPNVALIPSNSQLEIRSLPPYCWFIFLCFICFRLSIMFCDSLFDIPFSPIELAPVAAPTNNFVLSLLIPSKSQINVTGAHKKTCAWKILVSNKIKALQLHFLFYRAQKCSGHFSILFKKSYKVCSKSTSKAKLLQTVSNKCL